MTLMSNVNRIQNEVVVEELPDYVPSWPRIGGAKSIGKMSPSHPADNGPYTNPVTVVKLLYQSQWF